MFENLVAQPSSQAISSDILSGTFPQGALFSGPAFSGKLTAALEAARALSCAEGRGDDGCECPSCAAHRELSSPDMLIMGARSCSPEIRAAAASYLSAAEPNPARRLALARAVRKLTIRFSPDLAESPDAKLSRAAPLLSEISEGLEQLSSIGDGFQLGRAELEKIVAKIADSACKLDEGFLYSSIPVSAVRSVSSWLRVKPAGKAKALIIENADAMQEAARNALLKILEEPPEAAHFILTAERRSAVMPTILSRVRNYPFVERSAEAQEEALRIAFGASPSAGETVSSFINQFLPVKPSQIEECARRFVFAALGGEGGALPKMGALSSALAESPARLSAISKNELLSALNGFKPAAVWGLFLSALLGLIRRALRCPPLSPMETEALRRWVRAVRQARDSVFVFNLSPAASLERLDFELRGSAA